MLSPCLSVLSVVSVTLVYCGQMLGTRMDEDETWHAGIGLGAGHIVLDGDPAPPKGQSPKYFRPISVAAKWLHGSTYHLVWR